MKKILFIATLIFLFAACKKDRNCVCTYTGDTGVVITKNYEITHVTKKQADEVCEANEITVGTFVWTCSLEN